MSSIANPITSNAGTSGSTTPPSAATSPADPLASESTFLTLLVSQLQNQDPLDPVDSNQFVSQLTEYSQLEQLIGIHSDTTALSGAVSSTATTPPAATPTSDAIADPTAAITSNTNQSNSTIG